MLAIAAGTVLEALATSFFVACQVQGRQDREGRVKALGAGVGFGYGIIALLLGAAPLTIALFKLIETLTNLVAVALLIIPRLRPRLPSFRGIWTLAQQGLVFALIEITAIIYNKANLFFLQRYGGATAVAQYSVTQETVEALSGIISILLLQSIIFPLFVKLWEVDRNQVSQLAQNTARWLLTAALPLMWILFIESDRIILLIFGPQYQDAIWIQKYLVVTVVSSYLHNLSVFLMISMRRERVLLLFFLCTLAVTLGACSLLIPANPLLGATLAMIIAKVTLAALTVSYCQRQVGLISREHLLRLAGAAAAGLGAFFLAGPFLPRELAEALALAPLAALAWRWWRKR
jgi:O-antigen/teichoic acid export membrane protein